MRAWVGAGVLLWCVLAGVPQARTAESAPKDKGLAQMGWFAELAGSCWGGKYPDGTTEDVQCYEAQYGHFLGGTITVKMGGEKPAEYKGEALFAWDAEGRKITYWHWSDDGKFGSAEGFVEGELLRFPMKARPGQPQTRSTWTRVDADTYKVTREQQDGDAWKELFTVTYARVN